MRMNEMKPRIIKPYSPDDITKILQRVRANIISTSKKKGVHRGEIDMWIEGNLYYINVEMSSGSEHFVADIVSDTPHTEVVGAEYHPGNFDWASDSYIKDSATVCFKVVR